MFISGIPEKSIEFAKSYLNLQDQILKIREDIKDLKQKYSEEGVNYKQFNLAINYIKRQRSLDSEDLAGMEMFVENFEKDEDVLDKIDNIIPKKRKLRQQPINSFN